MVKRRLPIGPAADVGSVDPIRDLDRDPDRVRVAAAARLQDEVGSDEPVLLLTGDSNSATSFFSSAMSRSMCCRPAGMPRNSLVSSVRNSNRCAAGLARSSSTIRATRDSGSSCCSLTGFVATVVLSR